MRHGCCWRPSRLSAQHSSVPKSRWELGVKLMVLVGPVLVTRPSRTSDTVPEGKRSVRSAQAGEVWK